ncbi:MAG: RNA polymerase-associated protein RapA [Bacteroidales bacterium]|nr:RNA polymerase-associated protein RapA [Bacteroidales bacterium]
MTKPDLSGQDFLPGQRWVSNTEPEAGLGIVVELAHRRVTISFPAIGEQRVYAADNAPISRVRYAEDDMIRTADGDDLCVVAIGEYQGRFVYRAVDAEGVEQRVDELELDSFVQFSKPQDRLFSGQVDSPDRYRLRRETLDLLRRQQQSPVRGLQGARVQLLPHQFHIASEVASRHAPRVLLADEVGLGKTIEAGLIIHQQLISGRAARVLILVPDSLVHQWLVEMLRRFNLRFTILDEERCRELEPAVEIDGEAAAAQASGENPFDSAQLVLCGLGLLRDSTLRREQAASAGWDLLVVDEAHHLQWSEQGASEDYRCVETLAAAIPGLLLLTATPEQLGLESHFARLRLLDPARYRDFATFVAEEAGYRGVSELVERLLSCSDAAALEADEELGAALADTLGFDDGAALLDRLGRGAGDDFGEARDDVVDRLLDRHGTGRVLFRNTRETVSGFPGRSFNAYPLPAPAPYLAAARGATLDQRLRPETLLGDDWLSRDPRVAWLVDWLAGLRDPQGRLEKALVICAGAATARQLGEHLDLRQGIPASVFHEGMTLVERDRAAAYFADDEDSARVLVCSEIGSEGRNFQFVRHLVLFDLPLNPDLLEQRIGRLDRIGQRHTVQVHLPHYDRGAPALLARWYHEGLDAFESVCKVGDAVHRQVADTLAACLAGEGDDNDNLAETLIADTRKWREAAVAQLSQGRDRLLERSSCNPRRAAQVLDELVAAENPSLLADYMVRVFDQFGVDHSDHSPHTLVVSPGDHLQCEVFPGLPEDGLTVTFNRERALAREDFHFLSWEHPMVSGVMEMILGGDFGNATLCTLKLPPLKPGTLLLEALYTLHCSAPRSLQAHRYLPLTVRRLVVDEQGRDLSAVLGEAHLDRLGQKVAKGVAQDVVRHTRTRIGAMIRAVEQVLEAGGSDGDPVAQAIAAMTAAQGRELERLRALARVNPAVRQAEIDHVVATTEALDGYLRKAEWRLDALRVAVTV